MYFDFTAEQLALYDHIIASVRDWPVSQRAGQYWSRQEWQRLAEVGIHGLIVDPQLGGSGRNALDSSIAFTALGYGLRDFGLVFSAAAQLFACTTAITSFAEPGYAASLLPKICDGTLILGNAATESVAGSDLSSMESTAMLDGDHYVINGTKSYVSNGPIADWLLAYAITESGGSYFSASAFMIATDYPGVERSTPFKKMGLESCPACEVRFENCRVPAEQMIGLPGQGFPIFQYTMTWERCCLFAAYLGLMERQLEECIARARTRKQFGKSIGVNQSISHRLVDMKLRLESSRLLLFKACYGLDKANGITIDSALSKLSISEAVIKSSLDTLQIFGGFGYRSDSGLEVGLRDSVASTLFSGTSEVLRDLIASELGL